LPSVALNLDPGLDPVALVPDGERYGIYEHPEHGAQMVGRPPLGARRPRWLQQTGDIPLLLTCADRDGVMPGNANAPELCACGVPE
jgi:hypothetical protein